MMTRLGPDGELLTQLKGSAFFYVDVARQPKEPQKPGGATRTPTIAGTTLGGTSRS